VGVLANRNFVLFAGSRFLSSTAILMQSVAVGWQVYAKTGRVTDLGFVGLAQFLPFLLFILPSGQVADRHERRLVLVGCNVAYLAGSLLLLLYTRSGAASVLPIFAILALLGTSRAFAMPANQAILRNLVDDADFKRAVAFNSSSFHVAVVAGPVLGGFLYRAGPTVVHATVSTARVLATLMLLTVRSRQVRQERSPINWRNTLEGFRFVRSRPVVLGAISLDLFAVLFGGATAMLPAMAHDVLRTGPEVLGLLRAAPAAGAAVFTLVLAFFPLRRRVGLWMFGGVVLFGLSTIGFGLSHRLWLSLLCLFLLGVGDTVSVYIRHILVQAQTPDALRGRVSAVSAVFIGASNELGEFESGIAAGAFGLVRSVVLGGVMTLVVVGAWTRLFPALTRMDGFPKSQD
jgi:MFS family permease